MQKIKQLLSEWTGLWKLLPALGGSLNKDFPTLQKSLDFLKNGWQKLFVLPVLQLAQCCS